MIFETIDRPYNEQDVYDYLLETFNYSTRWTSIALLNKGVLFTNDNKPTEFLINQVKTYYEHRYNYNTLMWAICNYYWIGKVWNPNVIGLSFLSLETNDENSEEEDDEFIDDSEYENGPLVMHIEDVPAYPSRLSKERKRQS